MSPMFSFKASELPKFMDFGMCTSFDIINDGKVINKETGASCFAACYSYFCDPDNLKATHVKYYPWIHEDERLQEAALKFVELAQEHIPFFRERLIEFTGFNPQNTQGCSKKIRDKYALVDCRAPVGEGFVTLQILRLLQEKPGHIATFAKVLEEYNNPLLAITMALNFCNCEGTPRLDGHIPSNNFCVEWARAFIDNPEIARDNENSWSSCVLHPTEVFGRELRFNDALAFILNGKALSNRVAVYGTLRRYNGNHALLARAMEEKRAVSVGHQRRAIPAKMYDTGAGFPALVADRERHTITFEMFVVDNQTMEELDRLEGYPSLYDRVQLCFDDELYWVYVQDSADHYIEIKSGDWNVYIQSKRQGSVAKSKRFVGSAYL